MDEIIERSVDNEQRRGCMLVNAALPGNGRYCFPLTVTDHASRFLLLCEALESTRENLAITAFKQLFQERGLPQAIRSDNGVPFASIMDRLPRVPIRPLTSFPHRYRARLQQ